MIGQKWLTKKRLTKNDWPKKWLTKKNGSQ
jgi:hypothetical protein